MGQPGAAQFATAVLERNHRQRNVMPSSWPALRSCADGFNAQPSTGRATLTFTCAGANAAGAGAATIFCLARRLRRGAALSLARRLGGRRAACARLRGARAGAARVGSLLLPGNRRGESGAAAAGGRWRCPRMHQCSSKAPGGSSTAISGRW